MKRYLLIVLWLAFTAVTKAQVTDMNWSLDYKIYLKLENDSNFVYDLKDAFHVTNSNNITSDYVFYPVNPGSEYYKDVPVDTFKNETFKTLWGALHAKVGGGWVHFTNCIAYALETRKLDLTNPLMKRPESGWKPNPVTESYKRTKKWKYYVPVNQKLAQKEYKIREVKNELGDLKSLPQSYIDLFLNTSESEYKKLTSRHKYNALAKIDLVKVLLGSKYLSEAQILYISNSVLEAVMAYSNNMLPSVIVFDEFDAAALMSLDTYGYKIDKIVYKASENISDNEAKIRSEKIHQIVDKINEYNQNTFKKRLGNYYSN